MNTSHNWGGKRSRMLHSDSRSSSSKSYKLRTILKGRGSQQGQIQQQYMHTTNSKTNFFNGTNTNKKAQLNNTHGFIGNDGQCYPLSSSMKLNQSNSRLSLANSVKSASQNSMKNTQTLNCQQQLLGKQDFQDVYTKLSAQLEQLTKEADQLIQTKIRKVSKKTGYTSLKDRGKDQTSLKIQRLIQRVKNLPQKKLQKYKGNQQKIRFFIDRKIQLLQKLIAQSLTQSQLLKKHFFAINALRSQQKQGKIMKNSTVSIALKQSRNFLAPINNRTRTQSKESFFHESLNQNSYHAPKAEQYQTFRYKAKEYNANTQPLPRSSYKSQYLFYDQKEKQSPIKGLDNYKPYNKTRQKSSTYKQDFQSGKGDAFNYKELDGYKNKFKNIQMKYFSNNKKEQMKKQFQLSKSYMQQQMEQIYRPKVKRSLLNKPLGQNVNKLQTKHNPVITEAKSQYKGQQKEILTNIKHRRLNNFKYTYKTLINQ